MGAVWHQTIIRFTDHYNLILFVILTKYIELKQNPSENSPVLRNPVRRHQAMAGSPFPSCRTRWKQQHWNINKPRWIINVFTLTSLVCRARSRKKNKVEMRNIAIISCLDQINVPRMHKTKLNWLTKIMGWKKESNKNVDQSAIDEHKVAIQKPINLVYF